jgi:hypothetical protein
VAGSFPTNLSSAWSLDGSLLTFLFPMCLFIVVAGLMYAQYTRPHKIPGHHGLAPESGRAAGNGDAERPAGLPGSDLREDPGASEQSTSSEQD